MNENEIRDFKYVDKAELQAMFDAPGQCSSWSTSVPDSNSSAGNLFTPWFKLIARDFLFGWWDQLIARKQDGKVVAQSLADLVEDRVIKMT